jgi:hypothetical protein
MAFGNQPRGDAMKLRADFLAVALLSTTLVGATSAQNAPTKFAVIDLDQA